MADKKISQLTSAVLPLAGTEVVPVVQSGATVKVTAANLGAAAAYTPGGTGAVVTTVQSKLRESVSIKDFGAVGDGVADDTVAVQAAINTGKNVYVPRGDTYAITGNVTGFANNQLIYGGGAFKKIGTTIQPMFLLPDMSDGVRFDGIEFNGNKALFAYGNAVPAILGYITYSLSVTNCYFHDIIDCGIKLRDGANLYASGNRFIDIMENGIELHNYTTDVRTGSAYVNTRPVVEGNHTIVNNRFERITRYENPLGPLVDACGILFVGATGYPQKNVRITSNVLIDCLRCIWTENNTANSQSDGVVISNNTLIGGVNGGIAQNIYTKSGIGIISANNVVVSNNTIKNVANHAPVGTSTACITVSGSLGVSTGSNIEIASNVCIDDSGLTDRTQYGIYCLIGTNVRLHNNSVSGFSTTGIYLSPTNLTNIQSYANIGSESEQSWAQTVPLQFTRSNLPANGNQVTYPFGFVDDTEIIIPSAGRIVGVAVKMSNAISAGNVTVRSYSNGVEQTNVQIVTADFAGTALAVKSISALSGTQVSAGQRFKVVVTTDAAFLPTTTDIQIVMFVECGLKL